MTTFFTSDLHLGHRLVAGMRGFADPAEHDAELARRWRTCVMPGDQVWVLGDLAVKSSKSGVDATLAKVAALPGTKHLVPGNHDPVHPMFRNSHRWLDRYLEVFDSVQAFARVRIIEPDGDRPPTSALLSHFPYHDDHVENPRHNQYRLRDEGRWLLHGHTHSVEKVTSAREIHVGLDAWDLHPVAMSSVAELMAT